MSRVPLYRVKRYQLMLRGGIPSRFDVALNSCGNSDASDDNLSGDEFMVRGRADLYFITRDAYTGVNTNFSI